MVRNLRVRLRSLRNKNIVIEATMVVDSRGEISLKDFAYTRRSAIDRISSFGYEWSTHARKISDNPKSAAVRHWASELCVFWNACVTIKMKSGNGSVPMSIVREYLLDGNNVDFRNKALFNSRLLALGNRELSVNEMLEIINETILLGVNNGRN